MFPSSVPRSLLPLPFLLWGRKKKKKKFDVSFASIVYNKTRRHCQLSTMWHIWQCLQINMCHPIWTNNITCQNFIDKIIVTCQYSIIITKYFMTFLIYS